MLPVPSAVCADVLSVHLPYVEDGSVPDSDRLPTYHIFGGREQQKKIKKGEKGGRVTLQFWNVTRYVKSSLI